MIGNTCSPNIHVPITLQGCVIGNAAAADKEVPSQTICTRRNDSVLGNTAGKDKLPAAVDQGIRCDSASEDVCPPRITGNKSIYERSSLGNINAAGVIDCNFIRRSAGVNGRNNPAYDYILCNTYGAVYLGEIFILVKGNSSQLAPFRQRYIGRHSTGINNDFSPGMNGCTGCAAICRYG